MEIKIRHACENDLTVIVEITNQAIRSRQVGFLNEFSVNERREWFNEHAPDDCPILVAECNASVIGWVSISPYRKGREAFRKTVEVSYFVHSDYQGRGIGTALLSEIIRTSNLLRKSVMLAIIFHTNTGSTRLLEKHNFQLWGVMPQVAEIDGETLDHVYYGRKL